MVKQSVVPRSIFDGLSNFVTSLTGQGRIRAEGGCRYLLPPLLALGGGGLAPLKTSPLVSLLLAMAANEQERRADVDEDFLL
jgi:hypothetical protein